MANTYYDSQLTGEQIEAALDAISGVITPSNNGKVLTVQNGAIVARNASDFGGGSAPVLSPLSVTENRDYFPEAGVDGFDEVHVSVPNSYSASDEGKVVSNGALVAQTARASQITQNGTYDTTLNDEVTVNVSGGGTPTLITKNITQNGTYNASSDNADGYGSVSVNVSEGTTLPTLKIIDHAIAQHYNAVSNKYIQEYLQTALPIMAFKSYASNTSIFPRLASSQFDGVSTPSFYKPNGALTGIIFLQKVDKAYNKLYIKAKSAVKVSGQSSSIVLAIGSSNMAFNADGWLTDYEKSVALASSDHTAEQIMAQENLSIVSSDPSLLSEQTIVYSIPNVASDYYIGLTVWNQEIYICDMWLAAE